MIFDEESEKGSSSSNDLTGEGVKTSVFLVRIEMVGVT